MKQRDGERTKSAKSNLAINEDKDHIPMIRDSFVIMSYNSPNIKIIIHPRKYIKHLHQVIIFVSVVHAGINC